uniref:Shugoshin C-terminal domain-containing protein n=1 Tax=Salix viminalis TaxID=40686 RepID=A0A6N2LS41_SALVM
MEGILVLDSENINVAGNNIKGEKLGKGSIVGIASRRTLADISNFPVSRKTLAEASTFSQLTQDGKSQSVIVGKDYIEKVQRELNAGKDKLKVFQHELGCKNGLLSARNLELKVKAKKVRCRIKRNEIETIKGDGAAQLFEPEEENKPCNPKRKRQSKVQSLGTRLNQPQTKVNADKKSLREESTENNVDTKRRICRGNQSIRIKSEAQIEEPTEDLFQTDDARFHVPPIHGDPVHESCPTLSAPSVKTESETGNSALRFETQELRRTSLRPSRRAAEKVQSYKEIPLNVKMRRGG